MLDFVCEQGVDIFQSSIAQGTSCDGNGALDAEIEAMIDCDVIFVKGAANDGSTGGTCTTRYPADHPWTFAVAGIDTTTPCTTASAYYTADCDFADGSSMGGGDYNGVAGKASIIDIAAPWDHGAVITPDTLNPVVPTSGSGNSFANPFSYTSNLANTNSFSLTFTLHKSTNFSCSISDSFLITYSYTYSKSAFIFSRNKPYCCTGKSWT